MLKFRVGFPTGPSGWEKWVKANFVGLAEMIVYALRSLGHEAVLDSPPRWQPGYTTIIIGANEMNVGSKIPAGTIIYNLEQPGTHHVLRVRDLVVQGATLWEYSSLNFPLWDSLRIKYSHVQMGFSPLLGWEGQPKDPDIDVMFTGSINPRRAVILAALSKVAKVSIFGHADGELPAGLTIQPQVFGDDLNMTMERSKIVLNLHYYESKVFEITRIMHALANKKPVVTEVSTDDSDYSWLHEGIILVPPGKIPEACAELLKDPVRLKELGEEGFKKFSSRSLAENISRALEVPPPVSSEWIPTPAPDKRAWHHPHYPVPKVVAKPPSPPPLERLPVAHKPNLWHHPHYPVPAILKKPDTTILVPAKFLVTKEFPLVSALMPTSDRRELIPLAIQCFLRQTYPYRELVIVDNGQEDFIEDLLPSDPRIRYFRCEGPKLNHGKMVNLICSYAKGEVLVNWDDDDWSSDERMADQVVHIRTSEKAVVGFHNLLFWTGTSAFKYRYPGLKQKPYASGTTQMFSKTWWQQNPYQEVARGADSSFSTQASNNNALASFELEGRMVCRVREDGPLKLGHAAFPPCEISDIPFLFFTALNTLEKV